MNIRSRQLGSSYISVMIVAALVSIVAASVPSIMKVYKAREYQSYTKDELNRVESRIRMFLASPDKFEIITQPGGGKEVTLRPLTRQHLTQVSTQNLIGAQCDDGIDDCGIVLKSLQEDIANNKVDITIGFNGKNTNIQDRSFSLVLPSVDRVSQPQALDSCPQDRPVLAGLGRDGKVLCKTVGEVFRSHVSDAELCEVNLVDGCTPRSGRCPSGRYARVNDFKVRCYSLPLASCPIGQAVRNISVSPAGGLSFNCGPVARLEQLIVKPPVTEEEVSSEGGDVSLPVDTSASGENTQEALSNNLPVSEGASP